MSNQNEKIEKSWDSIWDSVFSNQEWGKYPSENLIQFVARNFYKRNRGQIKILEVGCGIGANLWYISREGFQAFGVDGSEVAILKARQRMQTENLNVNLQVSDIISLPFENEYFDAVIDNECIYSNGIENTRKILLDISRVMKSGALLYSRTFSDDMFIGSNPKSVGELEYSEIYEGPLNGKGFVRLSSKESIKKLYGEYFNIRSIDYLEYSTSNEEFITKEWIAVCSKG